MLNADKMLAVQVLRLGNIVPDFAAQTTQGDMHSWHEWIDGSWAILFSHPADFTVRPLLPLTRRPEPVSHTCRRLSLSALQLSADMAGASLPECTAALFHSFVNACLLTCCVCAVQPVCNACSLTHCICAVQPVCTTEIGRLALKYKELSAKGVKLATLSCDPVTDHQKWLDDVVAHCENKVRTRDFPRHRRAHLRSSPPPHTAYFAALLPVLQLHVRPLPVRFHAVPFA